MDLISKTRQTLVNINAKIEGTSGSTGDPVLWSSRSTLGENFTDSVTFTPYSFPNYRKLISQGSQVTSRMVGTRHSIEPGQFLDYSEEYNESTKIKSWVGLRGQLVVLLPEPPTNSSSLQDATNSALSVFASKLNDKVHQFQTGTFIGELREAIHMVRHPAQSLFKGIRTYMSGLGKSGMRRGLSSRAKRRIIADTWLEYSYGWKPLLSDIDDAAKALSEVTTYRLPRKSVKGEGSSHSVNGHGSSHEVYGPMRRDVTWISYSETKVKIYGQVLTKTEPFDANLQSFSISSFADFVPTIWELIPYSFLIDYFTNVGQMIYAASNPYAQVTWVNRGYQVVRETRLVDTLGGYTYSGNPAQRIVTDSHTPSGSASRTITEVVRDAYQGSLIPDFQLKIPKLLSTKWLNIAALASEHSAAVNRIARR